MRHNEGAGSPLHERPSRTQEFGPISGNIGHRHLANARDDFDLRLRHEQESLWLFDSVCAKGFDCLFVQAATSAEVLVTSFRFLSGGVIGHCRLLGPPCREKEETPTSGGQGLHAR